MQPRGRAPRTSGRQLAARVRSEIVFTMLPGPVPFTLLRDVLEADGRVLRTRGRLEPLFRASPTSALREAADITSDSEKLILGPTRRTLSVPTIPLAYLQPDLRDSFAFKRRGPATVRGESVVEVVFEEVGRPTLTQDGSGRDVPLRGAFWIRERDGAVLRTRTTLRFAAIGIVDPPTGTFTVTTEFTDDPGLDLLVPREMTEVLEWRSISPEVQQTGGLEGRARYSGFHRIVAGGAR